VHLAPIMWDIHVQCNLWWKNKYILFSTLFQRMLDIVVNDYYKQNLNAFFLKHLFSTIEKNILCACAQTIVVLLFVCLLLSLCLHFPKSTTLITLPNALMLIRNVQDVWL
jgi:hypothetical protein